MIFLRIGAVHNAVRKFNKYHTLVTLVQMCIIIGLGADFISIVLFLLAFIGVHYGIFVTLLGASRGSISVNHIMTLLKSRNPCLPADLEKEYLNKSSIKSIQKTRVGMLIELGWLALAQNQNYVLTHSGRKVASISRKLRQLFLGAES